MSNNIPVDIEFLIKNVNFEEEAAKIKKGITDVGITTDKVAAKMETDLVGSLNKASVAADNMNAKFKASANGINQLAQGNSRLNYSIQQVARELPTLALSPQMFILAISNNLPILQDQLRRTRLENEALKASGQQTTSVFKQVASSLMSWQTALVLGITVLTVYGKEIFAWIGGLVKGRDEMARSKKAIEEFSAATTKGVSNAQAELTKLSLLYNAATDITKSTDERTKAVAELQKLYPDYLKNIDSEIIMTGKAATAYDNLRRSIIDAAVAKAYESKITEAQIKIIELEAERVKKVTEFNKRAAAAPTLSTAPQGTQVKFDFNLRPFTFGAYGSSMDSLQKDIAEIDKQTEDLNAQITRYANNINISDLLFGPDGPNKPKKDLDELKQAEEALEKAVVGGNRAVIDQMAQRVAMLKKERELRQWIAEEAVAFANGTVTQAQRDSIFYPKPITGKTEAGTKVGDTRTTNKILYEVVAIDKTGPVWKKVGLESDKLRKKIEQNAKDAGKAQEKLDEDEINRKAENQERLLNYSRQFTGELIDQLGLTKEQSELLYGISDTMKNMSSGDILGAYFSAASIVLKSMKDSLVKTEDEDADYVANSINRQNQLLAVMKTYLATLRGEDYFVFAKETLKQYNSDLADTWTNLQKFKQVQLKERDPSTGAFIKINTQDFELNDWIELLNRMEKEGVWNDSPAFTDMKAFVAQIQDLGVAINALLEESWNNVTGTTRDTIADQIIAGFKKGTESGTDIMRNAVIEAFKTNLIEGDLTDWYKGFAEAGMDGFTKEEIDYWQKKYNEMIALQKEQWDNIEKITGVNPNDTETNASPKGLTGSIQGLTEETGGMIAGYLIGVKTDIRTIIGNMSRNDDDMVKKLGYLKEIAENTRHNAKLITIEAGIKETNEILTRGLLN